jgi:hypothetical protein
MRIILQNRDVLDGMETGWARLTQPVRKALHWAARNTRSGSSRNIQAHYDLGNDFFKLFLDPTMMYSSAIFEHEGMPLETASVAKLDRICRKLDVKPGDRVMEIVASRCMPPGITAAMSPPPPSPPASTPWLANAWRRPALGIASRCCCRTIVISVARKPGNTTNWCRLK